MSLKTQNFISKAKEIHKNTYDYSLTKYKHSKEYIDIICPIHGIFKQKPNNHLSGYGCNQCGYTLSSIKQKYTLEEYSLKASLVHDNKYTYMEYSGVQNKVTIECPIHGIFYQKGNDHLKGHGCNSCSGMISKEELKILEYLQSLNFPYDIITSYRPSWLNKKELDIYIPELRLAIEYNGSTFHHSSNYHELSKFLKNTSKPIHYHQQKWKLCFDNNVTLISIYDFQWLNIHHRKIIENRLNEIIKYLITSTTSDITHKVLDLDIEGYLLTKDIDFILLEPKYHWVSIKDHTIFYTDTNKPYQNMESNDFFKVYNNGLALIK